MTRDWRDDLTVGDVVRVGRTYRVVRKVSPSRTPGLIGFVTFTIRRRSWTGRGYTVLARADLATFGYVPTGARVTLKGALNARIQRCINAPRATPISCCPYELTRGIA